VGTRTGDKLGSAAEVTSEFSFAAVLGTFTFFLFCRPEIWFFLNLDFCFLLNKNSRGWGQVYRNVIRKLK
jgi:hypothetical protein